MEHTVSEDSNCRANRLDQTAGGDRMIYRAISKRHLKKLNRKAIKNHAYALDDEFFEQLRPDLKYLIWQGLPLDRCWHRCFVGYADTPRPTLLDFKHVLLDVDDSDFDELPMCKALQEC